MLEAQARALRHIETLTPGTATVLVSHCDVIRAVLTHWLGMPTDLLCGWRSLRPPSAPSRLVLGDAKILQINEEA